MDEKDPFAATIPTPTAARPLLGLTVLVIEDSRFACEAMRLLCLRSGARIRRADCLRSARRHLQVYRPSVVIVDLGLPDGCGAELITELTQTEPRVDVVLGTSGDLNGEALAQAAGCDGFLTKPIVSLAVFQQTILANLPAERQPAGLRELPDEIIHPDLMAFQDDMAHIADVLGGEDNETAIDYAAQFIGGVARSAQDTGLEQAADALAKARASGASAQNEVSRLASLVQQRLTRKLAI
ncbi:response regulator [Roseobacter denitrificans]|uniref:Response regulator, putative n=1 Tax=Roseobacter denitrificans (strain ATCC 33942 / OCh 114) TaxID=375451 RepID=Q16B14_ROSDO|nr:response regulator [Roseobacter denitrificans]ABG30829.1 response regulator, putative [Roseobacter denitrificans OCh 114]AVL53934.1 response regulator [Roseobacter denitrificans]SFG15653.1 Response regulator receiver domain-containing protein [Roseobacter denitrificans OCh 114]